MSETSITVPNAILFILDPKNRTAEVPEYVAGTLAHATESCASISTVADVDGEVNVQLLDWGDGSVPTGFHLAFDGTLQTPNKIVAIVTSHFKRVLQENVSKIKTRILIGVDDTVAPRRVAVRLES